MIEEKCFELNLIENVKYELCLENAFHDWVSDWGMKLLVRGEVDKRNHRYHDNVLYDCKVLNKILVSERIGRFCNVPYRQYTQWKYCLVGLFE